MIKKIFIFDIDGTLYSKKHKKILPNTCRLLKELGEDKEVLCGVATGRGKPKIKVLAPILKYLDFLVLSNGQYIEFQKKLISKHCFLNQDVVKLNKICASKRVNLGFTTSKFAYYANMHDSAEKMREKEFKQANNKSISTKEIYSLWLSSSCPEDLTLIKNSFDKLDFYFWNKQKGMDVALKGFSKQKGIEILKSYLIENQLIEKDCNVIAVGDGENDFEMLKHADLAVCMENSDCVKLKEIADFIAPSVDSDLLYSLFKRNLIDC